MIDTPSDELPRLRFRSNKSLTFKQKSLAGLKDLQKKFKEDNVYEKKEGLTDDKMSGKHISSGQFMGKRRSRPLVQTQMLGNEGGVRQGLHNNHAISPQKRMGRENNIMTMLQNQANPSPPRSSFSRKPPAVEGLNLRESIKTSMKIVTSGFGLNRLEDKLEKVENEESSVKAEKTAQSLNSLNSLTTLEEKASKWLQPTNNPIFLPTCAVSIKGFFGQRESVKKEGRKGHRRVSSIDIFKDSYKEDLSGGGSKVGSKVFPSLTDSL